MNTVVRAFAKNVFSNSADEMPSVQCKPRRDFSGVSTTCETLEPDTSSNFTDSEDAQETQETSFGDEQEFVSGIATPWSEMGCNDDAVALGQLSSAKAQEQIDQMSEMMMDIWSKLRLVESSVEAVEAQDESEPATPQPKTKWADMKDSEEDSEEEQADPIPSWTAQVEDAAAPSMTQLLADHVLATPPRPKPGTKLVADAPSFQPGAKSVADAPSFQPGPGTKLVADAPSFQPGPGTKLVADAPSFQPGPGTKLVASAPTFQPGKEMETFDSVLTMVGMELASTQGVADVDFRKSKCHGWRGRHETNGMVTTITLRLAPHASARAVMEAAKAKLLDVAANSESTYVLGYEATPFEDSVQGDSFSGILASMPKALECSACWDFYTSGCCPRGTACKWSHPGKNDLQPVRVVVV